MATNCYACGYRDNEIKSGGAVSDKGKKITLKVEDEEDLSRDLLKVSWVGLSGNMSLSLSVRHCWSRDTRDRLNPTTWYSRWTIHHARRSS
jgi:hypothetical protein